jgi:hypothetical protein
MGEEGRERRKRPRVAVRGEVVGRIHTVTSTPVLDLSENGALLELATALRPGTLYMLRLSVGSLHLNLRCRVVRTHIHSLTPAEGGETRTTYRAAVEFIDISAEDRQLLRAQLEGMGPVEWEFE